MNRAEALTLLGLLDVEDLDSQDIQDAYLEQLLPVKQYWLTNPIVEVLFMKRLAMAERFFEALAVLNVSLAPADIKFSFPELDMAQLVGSYEKGISLFKKGIGRSWNFIELEGLVQGMVQFHHMFEEMVFKKINDEFDISVQELSRNTEVKIAEQLPSPKLGLMFSRLTGLNAEEQFSLFTEAFRIEKRMKLKGRS